MQLLERTETAGRMTAAPLPLRSLYLLMSRYLKDCASGDHRALPALLNCIADVFETEFVPAVPKGTLAAQAVSRRLSGLLSRQCGETPPQPLEWLHALDGLIAWLVRHGVDAADDGPRAAEPPLH